MTLLKLFLPLAYFMPLKPKMEVKNLLATFKVLHGLAADCISDFRVSENQPDCLKIIKAFYLRQ